MRNRIKDQRGFTLLEAMLGIVILGIGIFAVGAMQMKAIKGNVFAKDLTQAVGLAQEQIEDIMFWDYDDLRLDDGDGVDDGMAGLDNNPDDPNTPNEPDERHPGNPLQREGTAQLYNLYWNVVDNYPMNNNKTMRILVTWAGEGAPKSVSVDYVKTLIN
jgi:prepilin-type N-terminal cleavage/methylation domain-containing protein